MKYLDLKEFMDKGYLQEVNRYFFHPLGLALEVNEIGPELDNPKIYYELRVQDFRDEPGGMIFDDEIINSPEAKQKAKNILEEIVKKADERIKILGYHLQEISE